MIYSVIIQKKNEVNEHSILNFKTKENFFLSTSFRKKVSKKTLSILKKSLKFEKETIKHYLEKCELIYFFFNDKNRSTRIIRRIVVFHHDLVITIHVFKNLEEQKCFLKHIQ